MGLNCADVCLVPLFSFLFNVFSCVYLFVFVDCCFHLLSREDWVGNFVFLVLFVACVLFPQLVYMLIVYMNEFWLETLLIPRIQK